MPSLLVSIVNWNTRESLRRCLVSLRGALAGVDAEVTVVDNASEDGSAEMVAAEFPEVRLLALEENLGFAGGNNAALEGRLDGTEHVLILNPDVELTREGVRALTSFLNATPRAAAVSPLLCGDRGEPQVHLYRRFPSGAQVALFWTVLRPLFHPVAALRRRVFEHDLRGATPTAVDQLPGAAICIRTSALRAIGPWDAGYFIWFEDVDWSYRARQAGYELYVLPAVRVRHEGGASFGRWGIGRRVYQFNRAYFRFLCKHDLATLQRWSRPVIALDLRLKDLALRAARVGRPGKDDEIALLRETRREIDSVLARHARGELVDFTDAGRTGGAGRRREGDGDA